MPKLRSIDPVIRHSIEKYYPALKALAEEDAAPASVPPTGEVGIHKPDPNCRTCGGSGYYYDHVQDDTGHPCGCRIPASPATQNAEQWWDENSSRFIDKDDWWDMPVVLEAYTAELRAELERLRARLKETHGKRRLKGRSTKARR